VKIQTTNYNDNNSKTRHATAIVKHKKVPSKITCQHLSHKGGCGLGILNSGCTINERQKKEIIPKSTFSKTLNTFSSKMNTFTYGGGS